MSAESSPDALDEGADEGKGQEALTEMRLKTPLGQLIMPDSFLNTVAVSDDDAVGPEFPGATAALAIRVEKSGGSGVWGAKKNERGTCWCCVAVRR